MTHDELPEHTTVCSHFFKHRDCKGCYPPQYNFYETPIDLPPPSSGRRTMTHDELIAYIDDSTDGLKHEHLFEKLLANTKALRAVVELHRPVHNAYDTDYSWWGCLMCEEVYPCPTIQAIEKELA